MPQFFCIGFVAMANQTISFCCTHNIPGTASITGHTIFLADLI